MRVIAVPVKGLARSKRRLSPVMSPLERGALTLALLEDVLDATTAVPGWESWVVSQDESVLEIAVRRGARPVTETKPTLSAALRQVEREATEQEASALAVLPADAALVTADALASVLHTLGPVVASPSARGGTNLLLRRPPRAIPSRFGPESMKKHIDAAVAKGLPAAVVERPELAFDLDLPEDIPVLLASAKNGRAREACLQMDLPSRLSVGA
ncbi:MAG: 2-phospho-L-lactate guanylyltransferase [Actinomycetota bacterium]